ncbi:hypothetical protein ABZN20_03490 [Methylococcus sp. ANG]|uniref:hypothetical protein n=1 Tax=Methylococcus sp. ANG TaxID=3231903 RepID=UPI00345A72F4
MDPLENSARQVLKGTLVPLKVPESANNSHGLFKMAMVNTLGIARGETDAVREHLEIPARVSPQSGEVRRVSDATLGLIRSFEAPLVPALRPGISAITAAPAGELAQFAKALVALRAERVRTAQANRLPDETLGRMMQALNAAVVAARAFDTYTAAQPIGMLNLERIEMVPAGIERGELVATIPLAPDEETAVTHKEWSVTSQEFTTIVTDSLEQTSETGVTDNTDLSQSTTSQNQHATQFNITATVQGGIPIISGSTTTGFSVQDSTSQSATDSIKHATSITEKASSRSRREHKTTISTTTVTGASETSTRMLKNTSPTDAIRIDYFSLMRKWRVRLYRFGLRLTYDMVIPEPGASMRRAYVELETLRSQLGPFVFNLSYTEISPAVVDQKWNPAPPGPQAKPKYIWLAERYGAAVRPYPANPAPIIKNITGAGNRSWSYMGLPFNVPAGTRVKALYVSALIGNNDGEWPWLRVIGARNEPTWEDENNLELHDAKVFANDGSDYLKGATGEQNVLFWMWHSDSPAISLKVDLEIAPETIELWQAEVWTALYNAAQARHFAQQQEIAARIGAIEERLANVDTLTLRREESDEIMKNVLKFVLGTDFDLMPDPVQKAFQAEAMDLAHGIAFDDASLSGLNLSQWTILRQHEEMVRFINQAIEWENVVSFLYSYFWDVPQSWPFIRGLRHPDATRQAFLRAGSARVVLTVRKGWEAKWMKFVQDGSIDADIAPATTGPYLSIAQEIAAYDDRNYPGIPPANPARSAVRLHDAVYTTCDENIAPGSGVNIAVASSTGFVVGLQVVLDAEDSRHVQEVAFITEIPDPTHIVVDKVVHAHTGATTPLPVLQPGDKGALIAEWFEYTPSSGTDIAITSNLATIA